MRVVLCHHCWTWIFPQGIGCPECQQVVTLDDPDPALEELTERLGTSAVCLGEVRWERPKLPSRGELWGTSAGLIYWPYLVNLPNGSIVPWEPSPPQESSWSVFSLWHRTETRENPAATPADWNEFPTEAAECGTGFLNAPGAAFLARDQLARIQCRGRHWTIHRTTGRAVRFTAIAAATAWKPVWQSFLQQDAWRHLAPG